MALGCFYSRTLLGWWVGWKACRNGRGPLVHFGRCPVGEQNWRGEDFSSRFRLFKVFYVFCGHECLFSKGTNSLKTGCELSCVVLSHRNGNRSSFLQPRECVSTSAFSSSSMKAFHSPRILCLFLSGVYYFNAFVNETIFTIRLSNYPVASEI